ncbi:hypothetical protein D3C73_1621130 [compost metagenome]
MIVCSAASTAYSALVAPATLLISTALSDVPMEPIVAAAVEAPAMVTALVVPAALPE